MVNINRMYKAILKVDPDCQYLWYVNPGDGLEVEIEAKGYCKDANFQAYGEILATSMNYELYFQRVKNKMDKIREALND